MQRGNAHTKLGDRRPALADFRLGIETFPRNMTFWRSTISTLIVLTEEAEVKLVLDKALATFASSSGDDLAALAEVFSAADRQSEALAYAEEAVKADPTSANRQLLVRVQTRRGQFDRIWPHLLALQDDEQRRMRTTRLLAKVAAGRASARPWTNDGEPDRSFPQAVFDAIERRSSPLRNATDRLRVLHVTSSLGAGGAERQLTNTVLRLAELRETGVEVELAVEDLSPAHGRDFFLPPISGVGTLIHCLREERQAGNWRDMLARRPDMRGAVQAIASMPDEVVRIALPLLAILLERQPDVVQLWQDTICIAGGVAAVLAGVPRILLSTRSTHPVERQRARPYLASGFRALLRQPGVSLFNNSQHGAHDYEAWLRLPPGSIEVVRNGYDFEAIRSRVDDGRSRQIHHELGIPPEAPVLGGVMRCSFEKRPELWTETAIELCHKMPTARGILVGDGPMMGQMKGRVADCGLADRIHYVGRQSPVEPWMRAMDLLFLSSLTEGLPNVLIEA
jgi:glycosyltransferase involved in cell wall biosynthesis